MNSIECTYNKNDSIMTKGVAILSMLILHLFCRKGNDVFGQPLIWLTNDTPLVYYFGFFAEICVPLYCLCIGYAQQIFIKKHSSSWNSNLIRILKLLVNYWIILILFCTLGLFFDPTKQCPGNITNFLKSIVLLHSYNGAWWFLKTYTILMLIPPQITFYPVKRIPTRVGLFCCALFHVCWYCFGRFEIIPSIPNSNIFFPFLYSEITKFISVFPYILAGAFLCKGNVVYSLTCHYNNLINKKHQKIILLLCSLFLFAITVIIHKAVLIPIVSVFVFLLFNIWEKGPITKKFFLFIGKHSTNIWLTHMFFYAYIFYNLIEIFKFPFAMLIILLGLCIITSYVIKAIEYFIYRFLLKKWTHLVNTYHNKVDTNTQISTYIQK